MAENTTTARIHKNILMTCIAILVALSAYGVFRFSAESGRAAAAASKVEEEKFAPYLTLQDVVTTTATIAACIGTYLAWKYRNKFKVAQARASQAKQPSQSNQHEIAALKEKIEHLHRRLTEIKEMMGRMYKFW